MRYVRWKPCVLIASGALLASCSENTGPRASADTWVSAATFTYPSTRRSAILAHDLVALSSDGGEQLAVIDPGSGRTTQLLTAGKVGSWSRSGSVLVHTAQVGGGAVEFRFHDATSGQVLFAQLSFAQNRAVLGTLGALILNSVGDSIFAQDRTTGMERWRRSMPRVPCAQQCGSAVLIDSAGGQLLLLRRTDIASALIRVSIDGAMTGTSVSHDAFRKSSEIQYVSRAGAAQVLTLLSPHALTLIDPTSGETRRQVRFDSLRPPGFYAQASRVQLSRDGAFATVRLIDSTNLAPQPRRDIVLRTSDGAKVSERTFDGEASTDLADDPCGARGRVRVLNDLRLEFTDLSTGRISTSSPVNALAPLRTVAIVTGFTTQSWITAGGHLVLYSPTAQQLVGVACE